MFRCPFVCAAAFFFPFIWMHVWIYLQREDARMLIELKFGRLYAGIEEVKSRLVVAPPKYIIKVVDKNGVRVVAEV